MNSRAFGKGSLFETEAFCLSGTSPTDKNSSLRDLPAGRQVCLCGEYIQFHAVLNDLFPGNVDLHFRAGESFT